MIEEMDNMPINLLRSKIIKKIMENRVTLITGEAGCGKSCQVPLFILEENMGGGIICTQPSRLSVVAVARRVAGSGGFQVGGEVGYVIGHSKVLSSSSKIVFTTSGVLLDMLREGALKYKVIILDDIDERTLESDLVLACVKQFLLEQNDLRVVLLSSIADYGRYCAYFNDLDKAEKVEVVVFQQQVSYLEQAEKVEVVVFQQQVSYLEQMTQILGISSRSSWLEDFSKLNPLYFDAGIKSKVHTQIRDLVIHIHKTEPDMEKSILVFLPTYNDLEQQLSHLKCFTSEFIIHALHSSTDIEQALGAMKIRKSIRKVILATNVAESSVAIPDVSYVIDSCRTQQVYWDRNTRKEVSATVWVSKYQADQRRGRTSGHVYRLVPEKFYNNFSNYKYPAILRLSLSRHILLLYSLHSMAICDPMVLLQNALDPPHPDEVQNSLEFLVNIGALERVSPGGQLATYYEATFCGRLLASIPLSIQASLLILKFAMVQMLRIGIVFGVLMDTQPLPIVRPLGQDHLFEEYTAGYYSGDSMKTGLVGQKEKQLMANFAAFQFWQQNFKDKHRLDRLQDLNDEKEDLNILLSKKEENWCSSNHLIQTSLHHVAEIYDDILNTMHRFRPTFLSKCGGLLSYDKLEGVAVNFANIIKEIRWIQSTRKISHEQINLDQHDSPPEYGEATPCVFFYHGMCNRGGDCVFSHQQQAKNAACKFFSSLKGCLNGEFCHFSHDEIPPSRSSSGLCIPEEEVTDSSSLLQVFPAISDGYILILDDTDFRFSLKFALHWDPSSIICTTSQSDYLVNHSAMKGISILAGLSHPYQTLNEKGGSLIPWNQVKCVLWFPFIDSFGGDWEEQKSVLKTFFEYLSARLIADALSEVQIILTMNNIRFSQLQAENLGRESFFFLKESFPYDEATFGLLYDTVTVEMPMLVSKPVCYVFYHRQPPT